MIIPNYEILKKIGESPQAVIYKVYHKKSPDRLLTLKVPGANFLPGYKNPG